MKEEKVDPNPNESRCKSPLLIACGKNNLDIVQMLMKNPVRPADPYLPDWNGFTAFQVALYSGSVELVNLISESLKTVNLNLPLPNRKETPLAAAVEGGSVAMVETLLEAGADPNLKSTNYPIIAAIHKRNLDMCKVLLKHGCSPNVDPHHKPTPIGVAVKSGQSEIIKFLCEEGAHIPHIIEMLDWVITFDDPEILEYLLKHIFNKLSDPVLWGEYFLETAIIDASEESWPVLLRMGMYTCSRALPIPTIATESESIFKLAAENGNVELMKKLIEFRPHCLQESWLICDNIQVQLNVIFDPESAAFVDELLKARKHPSKLLILCRAKITQQLGYNPVEKVHQLQLPNMLKGFLQFKTAL